MQPVDTLLVFFLASLLLALTPGPDNFFVLAQAAQRGKMAGIAVTVGLCTGLLVHTSAVALGVAAIFQASAFAFSLLKYIGAGYLLYLAYRSFVAGGVGGYFRKSARAQIILNRIAGGVFVVLAIKLALVRR